MQTSRRPSFTRNKSWLQQSSIRSIILTIMVPVDPLAKSKIPKLPGTYTLILQRSLIALSPALFEGESASMSIDIGKLGRFDFPGGWYVYIGSAFGPGGLAGRLKHHLAPFKLSSRVHWHIDYLRRQSTITEVWYTLHEQRREHLWAKTVQRLPGATVIAPRFGASDCSCRAHLFHFPTQPPFKNFHLLIKETLPGDAPVTAVTMANEGS